MNSFSPETLKILKASRWKEDREINIEKYIQALEANNYTVFPSVRSFLKQFGGLQLIKHLVFYRERPLPEFFKRFTILQLLNHRYSKFESNYRLDLRVDQIIKQLLLNPEIYAEALNTQLCPVGEDRDGITYVMNPEGKVYGLYELVILFIGNSGEEAIENWCTWTPSNPFPTFYTIPLDD